MAFKVFTNGSTLQASEVNDNLMRQAVATFSNAAARTAAITAPSEGMLTYLEDVDRYQWWSGSAWRSPFGSTLVASSDFSAQTSVAFDNIFTSEFRFYDIYIKAVGTAALAARLRNGSTDLSTSYVTQTSGADDTVIFASRLNSNEWVFADLRANLSTMVGWVANPIEVQHTQFSSSGFDDYNPGRYILRCGTNRSIASYNGIRFFPASGNMTGTISIYGRRG